AAQPYGVRSYLSLGPVVAGVAYERALTERRELGDELLAHRVEERRGDPDVMESARVVVQAEQQASHHRAGAVLVPAEAGDHSVGRTRVFDLDHRALAGAIRRVQALRHDAVEPG